MVNRLKLDDLQSYGGLFAAEEPPARRGEQRQSSRKPLEADGVLRVDGIAVDIRTVDISAGGLSLRSPKQLAVGKECRLEFALPAEGATHLVAAVVQVIYCFYTTERDFKAGVEFLEVAATGMEHIRRFADA